MSNRNLTAATIGAGTAVHAVEYDINDPKFGLVVTVLDKNFSAPTFCGQTAGSRGYHLGRTNGSIEAEVTCRKCLAKLSKVS